MMLYVRYEREDDIGILSMDRPESLNVLNRKMVAELTELLEEIAASDLRCLIVTGAGEKAFAAGADIAEMKDLTPEHAKAFSRTGNTMMRMLEELPMPTIAAVNGYALGGGCELALACDIRVASEKAVFGLPEAGLGVIPGYGGIQRLVRTVGLAKAKELVFTGCRLKADEALAIGLTNAVVPGDSLMEAAKTIAKKIAANAPVGVRSAKRVANNSVGLSLHEAVCLETELFAACFGTADQRMVMSAFLEKKKPEAFTGK